MSGYYALVFSYQNCDHRQLVRPSIRPSIHGTLLDRRVFELVVPKHVPIIHDHFRRWVYSLPVLVCASFLFALLCFVLSCSFGCAFSFRFVIVRSFICPSLPSLLLHSFVCPFLRSCLFSISLSLKQITYVNNSVSIPLRPWTTFAAWDRKFCFK